MVGFVVVVYLGALLAYGLVIWEAPLERAAALLVAAAMVALMLIIARRDAFARRAFVEVRIEQDGEDRVVVEATVEGLPLDGAAEVDAVDGDTYPRLRSAEVDIPASRAQALKLRVHRVTSEGDSEPLAATAEVRRGSDVRQLDVDGSAVVRIEGAPCRIRLSFPERA